MDALVRDVKACEEKRKCFQDKMEHHEKEGKNIVYLDESCDIFWRIYRLTRLTLIRLKKMGAS
jgi:hypothetical protein